MSNPDKHKPLSAEELFKLLDKPSNTENDFDGMDDFEKEALEGFSAHSNAQKAKALTDELNIAISKKATQTPKGDSKNKIIWFSAAASIVLIIMLSVFFFNKTKEDSVSNIALNESKEDKAPEALIGGSHTTESSDAISDNNDADTPNEPAQKISLNDNQVGFSKNAEGERLAGGVSAAETTVPSPEYRAENKPDVLLSEKAAKDEAKNKSNLEVDDLKKQGDVLSDNVEAKSKEKRAISQEQDREESLASQTLNTVVTSNTANNAKGTKEEDGYYKADADKTIATKKSLEKESVAKPVASSYDKSNASTEAASGKVAPAPASVAVNGNASTSNSAYYDGSELAIRDYVVKYIKDKKSSMLLAGTYKVKGNVSVEGKLKVGSILQITKLNCNCEDEITEALNSMTKWNSAIEDGKKISSSVEFTLAF